MDLLDDNYERFKDKKLVALRICFILQYTHPFSDGNGRIGKALYAILTDNLFCKVKSFEQHKQLCTELELLQCSKELRVFEDRECYIHVFSK